MALRILFRSQLAQNFGPWKATVAAVNQQQQHIQCRGMKHWPEVPDYRNKELPPIEQRLLPPLQLEPTLPPGIEPFRMQKRKIDMRGPELVHNKLLFKQYGLIALSGCFLEEGHIDMIRNIVNRHLDTERMFAIWRIEPPWKPKTNRGFGKKMGGGKGKIVGYTTPVKAGRIIFEVAGRMDYQEVDFFLHEIATNFPGVAMPISEEIFESLRQERKSLEQRNQNPFNMKRMIEHNFGGVHSHCLAHDLLWAFEYE